LRCLSNDEAIQRHFLTVGGPFLACLGEHPAPAQVSRFLETLVALFRALSEAPRKSVQGLWAELYLVTRAQDPRAMVKAWHATPGERYDFSGGSQRIEVKCAVGRGRVHHFSLEQLTPPDMTVVLIASLCTERSGGGTSLRDLLERARAQLSRDPSLLLRLESVVGGTMGEGLGRALDEAYDLEMANQSLRFFEVAVVPRPQGPIPREVREVRFTVDLTHIEAVELALFTGAGGLFRAAAPS